MAVLLWVIVIGFIAGVIARLVMPGPHTPKGFVVTTIIGVAGALLATVVGDLVGLYRPGQGAGLIGATIGALVILFIWNRLVAAQVIPDHGL
ncbi:MAG: GlsB/YeaQ/YmgE family stress response membrane protein [Pseudolabrys sp.]